MAQNIALSIYYDGLCPLCSREMDHYRKQEGSEAFAFVDITDPSFNAANEGLDPLLVHKAMHVKTRSGELQTGVDAFIAIWKVLPRFQLLGRMAGNPLVKPVLNVGYQVFALVRPYLPRQTRDCELGSYCETRRAP